MHLLHATLTDYICQLARHRYLERLLDERLWAVLLRAAAEGFGGVLERRADLDSMRPLARSFSERSPLPFDMLVPDDLQPE